MLEKIQVLDDASAIRILTVIAQAHAGTALTETKPEPELQEALKNEFGLETVGGSVSDGEMARQALLLLAQDPTTRERIIDLAEQPTERFAEVEIGMLIAGAILFVYKTHFEFRYEDGKPTVIIKSKPLDRELLKGFAEKFPTWIPSGPFKT